MKEIRLRSLGLTRADAKAALAVVPGAEQVAAEKEIRTHQVYSDFGSGDVQASAVDPAYFELASLKLGSGRALTEDDERSLAAVAVLGHQAARTLFVKIVRIWPIKRRRATIATCRGMTRLVNPLDMRSLFILKRTSSRLDELTSSPTTSALPPKFTASTKTFVNL